MPQDGLLWYHLTLGLYASWLPGDPRGFRDHDHKIHSSGDYKHLPPPGEHEGLFRWCQARVGEPTRLPPFARAALRDSLREAARRQQRRLVTVAACRAHLHAVIELASDEDAAKKQAGYLKKSVTQRWKLPKGRRLWSGVCDLRPIYSEKRRESARIYVTDHILEGGATWDVRRGFDPEPSERGRRKYRR